MSILHCYPRLTSAFGKRDARLSTHPLILFFLADFVCRSMAAAAGAIPSTLLCVRAADAFFAALLGTYDIKCRRTNNQHNRRDCNIINHTHNYALRAYSALSCLFFLMIIPVKIATIPNTIAQPTTGIQSAPKLPPVKSVPKKNTRNPIV